MKWFKKQKRDLPDGALRVVTRFLWSPMEINGETRWLEKATWTEVYRKLQAYTTSSEEVWDKVKWDWDVGDFYTVNEYSDLEPLPVDGGTAGGGLRNWHFRGKWHVSTGQTVDAFLEDYHTHKGKLPDRRVSTLSCGRSSYLPPRRQSPPPQNSN